MSLCAYVAAFGKSLHIWHLLQTGVVSSKGDKGGTALAIYFIRGVILKLEDEEHFIYIVNRQICSEKFKRRLGSSFSVKNFGFKQICTSAKSFFT